MNSINGQNETRSLCVRALKSYKQDAINVRKLLEYLNEDDANVKDILVHIPWYEGFTLTQALVHWKDMHATDWGEKEQNVLKKVEQIVDWREECFDDFWYRNEE